MALGVAALVLALAALSGFQTVLRREILSRTPEIEIRVDERDLADELQKSTGRVEGVKRTQLTISGIGWLVLADRVLPVDLVGYEGYLPRTFGGSIDRPEGLYLSETVAANWSIEPGDVVEVASSRSTLTPVGPRPRTRRLPLRGTFVRGKTEQRERVALPLAATEALFGRHSYRLLVSTGDLQQALAVEEKLRPILPDGVSIHSWRELNRALFFALRLEKSLMFLAVALIVFVAALALVSDLSLIIANKQREIGMLGAMGARPRMLMRSFVLLGCALAAAGIALGLGLGIGGALLLERFRLVRLPGSVYFLDYVPFLLRPLDVVAVAACAAVIAVAATTYAARGAIQLEPVEALRR
jgi:lipoprotein-releasing system permease protein